MPILRIEYESAHEEPSNRRSKSCVIANGARALVHRRHLRVPHQRCIVCTQCSRGIYTMPLMTSHRSAKGRSERFDYLFSCASWALIGNESHRSTVAVTAGAAKVVALSSFEAHGQYRVLDRPRKNWTKAIPRCTRQGIHLPKGNKWFDRRSRSVVVVVLVFLSPPSALPLLMKGKVIKSRDKSTPRPPRDIVD